MWFNTIIQFGYKSEQTLKDALNSFGFIDTIKVFNRKEKEFFIDHEKHGERNFS